MMPYVKYKPLAVTPRAACDLLAVGVTKPYELINAGEIEVFKIGRGTRVLMDSIDGYVERRLAERL